MSLSQCLPVSRAEFAALLLPHLAGTVVEAAGEAGGRVVLLVRPGAARAACPGCGTLSGRVHGGYPRRLHDVPAGGRDVVIVVAARRFRCLSPDCPKATFTEQVAGLTSRYSRRTPPLAALLGAVAAALCGRAGARLAAALGAAAPGRQTMVRLVMAAPLPQPRAAPRVLGVDDFALRKGHAYGTVLVDVETGRVVDLLPDREAATFREWLHAHPGAEAICRDRGGAYARAARDAAPAALQVADRFHLWQDLAEAVEKTVLACLAALSPPPPAPDTPETTAALDAPAPAPGTPAEPDGFRDGHGHERRLVARHRERYAAAQARRADGCPIREIARRLDLNRDTAVKFANAASIDALLVKATSRPSILDPYKPYPGQRRNQGTTSAAALHEEIRARGWTGDVQAVRRYLRQFRTADGRDRKARAKTQLTAPAAPPPPKPRQVTRWIMTHPDHLASDDDASLARLLDVSPALAAAAGHVRSFAAMMTRRQGLLALEDWLTQAEASGQPALHSFARGIRRDQQAVTAGLALPYNSGALEGRNCKTKYLKRLMYGRANFDLLRKMALLN